MTTQLTDNNSKIVKLRGNKDFKSEELLSYELGYRNYFSKNFFLDSSLFFNQYDNLRTYEYEYSNDSEIQYLVDNGLYGNSYGLELASKISILDDLDIALNYTFLKLELHKKIGSTAINPESDEYSFPENQFSFRSYYNFLSNFSWNNILFYVGDLKKDNIGSYFRFDSNIGWQIKENIKFTLAGQNLFNNRRQEFVPFVYQEVSFEEASKIYAKINIIF
jgi:iron complex outermembrane receptor protein